MYRLLTKIHTYINIKISMNVDVTVETQPILSSPTQSTFSVKQLSCNPANFHTFGVYQGTASEPGTELYTIDQQIVCQSNCPSLPVEANIYEDQEVTAKILHVSSKLCCERVTTHRVYSLTPAGKVAISDITLNLSKCGKDFTINASPYFKSNPAGHCFLTVFAIFIMLMLVCNNLTYVYQADLTDGLILTAVLVPVEIALLIYLLYNRGCACTKARRKKLLELRNISDDSPAAVIYMYCFPCFTRCQQSDYEIDLTRGVDKPRMLTLIGITIRLHWALHRFEA